MVAHSYPKAHFQFRKIFLQVQQEALYLVGIFQSMFFKFLEQLSCLQSHPGAVKNDKVTTIPASNNQDHSKMNIVSGLGDNTLAILEVVIQVVILRPPLIR